MSKGTVIAAVILTVMTGCRAADRDLNDTAFDESTTVILQGEPCETSVYGGNATLDSTGDRTGITFLIVNKCHGSQKVHFKAQSGSTAHKLNDVFECKEMTATALDNPVEIGMEDYRRAKCLPKNNLKLKLRLCARVDVSKCFTTSGDRAHEIDIDILPTR